MLRATNACENEPETEIGDQDVISSSEAGGVEMYLLLATTMLIMSLAQEYFNPPECLQV